LSLLPLEVREEQERRAKMGKANAKRAWIADGGSEANFETLWPEMRDEARRERIISAKRRARESM
jgi:hypothetical protein